MSLELFRNWMRTPYTNVYWQSVCTSSILCARSMARTLGMSSTSLCSRQAIMISDKITTPVLPTPALQWTSNGGLGLFGSLVLFVWRRTDWISSRYDKNPLRSSGQPCSGQSVYWRCQTVLSWPVRRCFIFKPVVA